MCAGLDGSGRKRRELSPIPCLLDSINGKFTYKKYYTHGTHCKRCLVLSQVLSCEVVECILRLQVIESAREIKEEFIVHQLLLGVSVVHHSKPVSSYGLAKMKERGRH